MALSQRLRTAIERVDEIMSIAGVPGMSFAIIQNGETVGTFHRGFRDVARQLPPNDQTRWNVDSVSKAFTAAVTGITVHEGAGALNWESPIRTWLPEAGFSYNNLGLELVGQTVEKVHGKDLETLHRGKIWAPLNMTRATFHCDPNDDNQAKSYGIYGNNSAVEIRPPFWQEGLTMSCAGGVKASIEDLLVWYKTTMRSIMDQVQNGTDETAGSPLKNMRMITSQHVILPGTSLHEQGYGLGWARAQLPGVLGSISMNAWFGEPPIVGKGGPERLVLYHNGLMPGTQTAVMMVPELDTAVVVLQNAMPKLDTADFVAQMLLEALLEVGEPNGYVQLAREFVAKSDERIGNERRKLDDERIMGTKPRDLRSYVGVFCDDSGLICMDVRVGDGRDDDDAGLTITHLIGTKFDDRLTLKLNHYHNDTFTCIMSDKELAERAMANEAGDIGFWKFVFASSRQDVDEINQIRWFGDQKDWTIMNRVPDESAMCGHSSGPVHAGGWWGASLLNVHAFLVLGAVLALLWGVLRRGTVQGKEAEPKALRGEGPVKK